MSFQDIIEIILNVKPLNDGTDDAYVPYVNGQGNPNDINRPLRSDYNDGRPVVNPRTVHGGVDINYAKRVNGSLTFVGPNNYPNVHPDVKAPVSGTIIKIDRSMGQVSILCDGYVHTILHMNDIPPISETFAVGKPISAGTFIGKMDGMDGGNPAAWEHHVHYEISTYLDPARREFKIDPEKFWDNNLTNGRFLLTGSFRKKNQFYGTLNDEILKGEEELSEREAAENNGVRPFDPSDDDTLSGGGGSDIIDGGTGDDKLFGGNVYGRGQNGNDLFYKIIGGKLENSQDVVKEDADTSADYLIGGEGKDYLDGGKGNDFLYGGVATIDNGQVTYDASTDTDTSNDTLKGGRGNDVLFGGKGNDTLAGGLNNDTLSGSDDDTLSGGEGKDILDGGKGNDYLYGGVATIANGKVTYNQTADTDTSTDYLIGGEGEDYLDGGKGDDYLYGGVATIADGQVTYDETADTDTSSDTLKGGKGNDVIYGGKGYDYLYGGTEDDTLYGGEGVDYLYGEENDDILYGGKDDDLLVGGPGNDTMYGGENNDFYIIEDDGGIDKIEDKEGDCNTISFCEDWIKFFYKTEEGKYESPDGSLKGEIINGEFHVTLANSTKGTQVILNENFAWGDFGTSLITLPANPDIDNTINGTYQGWRGYLRKQRIREFCQSTQLNVWNNNRPL